ncbi:nuclear pore complex protein DDB_G0274915 [Uranotaenia lowii]|uniref:nuclear pore complex protein DDB_G0274915 n=1 Tax=Uranotaenia lowii TaxID=190385 RepID=UPI002478782B|nr:nuclear pore complex protein DDB_G0274915 [Uranotaenia lowii]
MPSKKKKYNARFPAGRIKKIMQTDEEVGKVAQAVPVIISRTLELFVESLLTKTLRITNARNAKTLSPSHMKQCIFSESRFDFLRDLVKNIPDIGANEEPLSGSETGYGNEAGASPASTSTSSSSNGGGAGGSTISLIARESLAASVATQLQRSESYTPSGSNYAPQISVVQTQQGTGASGGNLHAQNQLKRTLNHANSLNFYKEISLEESAGSGSGSNREPPPKLARLHSAPAANAVPIKIDIVPNPVEAVLGAAAGGRAQSGSVNSSNFKICYGSQTALTTPTVASIQQHQQPLIKLDYSNLQLPSMTTTTTMNATASSQQHSKQHQPTHHRTINQTRNHQPQQQQQPTIKIDLSNITNFAPGGLAVGGPGINYMQKQEVPSTPGGGSCSTPSTPLSTMSIASSSPAPSSGSSASSRNPYVFQSSSVPAAGSSSNSSTAPLFSSVQSSTIPGMDEDYDDI